MGAIRWFQMRGTGSGSEHYAVFDACWNYYISYTRAQALTYGLIIAVVATNGILKAVTSNALALSRGPCFSRGVCLQGMPVCACNFW